MDKAKAHYFTNKGERVSLTTELKDNSIIHVRHVRHESVEIENEPSGFIRHCCLVMVTRGKISPTVIHVLRVHATKLHLLFLRHVMHVPFRKIMPKFFTGTAAPPCRSVE